MDKSVVMLEHLIDCIPGEVQGFSSSMYTIALEGWRRGLTLKFVYKNKKKSLTDFVLANENRIYRFSGSRGNVIPTETINLCANKYNTKLFLKKQGIPVLEGKLFEKGISNQKIVNYVSNFNYPVVIKPRNGTGGEGVILNIKDEEHLRKALIYVRKRLQYTNIIIERYIPSIDYQLYVVGDKVVAAFERVAANVIGDGKLTIKQLINRKTVKDVRTQDYVNLK